MKRPARPARPDGSAATARHVPSRPRLGGLPGVLALGLFGLMCLLAQPAAAQWVWKDANGRVTASDRAPPKNVPEKDIVSRPQPGVVRAALSASSPAGVAPAVPLPTAAERDLEARKRSADQAKEDAARAAEQKLAGQRAENCRRARSHQAALQGGQRIARTNEKGEREILDDKGRAEELRVAREIIASDCGR